MAWRGRKQVGKKEEGGQGKRNLHMSQLFWHNESVVAHKSFPRSADAGFAVGGEGKLGVAGVAAIEGPFCLAVAHNKDARGGHCLR